MSTSRQNLVKEDRRQRSRQEPLWRVLLRVAGERSGRRLPSRAMAPLFLVAALFLGLVCAAAYRNTDDLLRRQRVLAQEYRALTQIDALLPSLREAGTACDSYRATGNAHHLTDFEERQQVVAGLLRSLHTTVTTPDQQKQVERLVPLVQSYLAQLDRSVRSERSLRIEADVDRGMQVTREIGGLRQEAQARLVRLESGIEDAGAEALSFLLLRTFGGVGGLTLCFVGFLRFSEGQEREERALRRANTTLASLAAEDPLTGLMNRRAFNHRLQREWDLAVRRDSPLSILLLDLDGFKSYNDTFGHLAGDEVLKLAAECISRRSRTTDVTARYGGEEFMVLLPRTSGAEAMVEAERIRSAFLGTLWPHRPVTVSIGVATYSPALGSVETFLHEADLALYAAKHQGRNRVSHARERVH